VIANAAFLALFLSLLTGPQDFLCLEETAICI